MQWRIDRRANGSYMTDKIYLAYHRASMMDEKLVSVQSPNSEQYVGPADLSGYEYIELPDIHDIAYDACVDIFDVLKNRRTIRFFSKDYVMSFEDFCKFVQFSMGKSFENNHDWTYRTYPSGGSRYPVDIYIVPQRVEGLKEFEVYRLDQPNNRLYDMGRTADKEEIKNATCATKYDYHEYMDSNLFIFMVSSFEKSTCKYGLLGYRLTFLEAGHIGENLSLVAERMGFNSVPLGGFYERNINTFLGADKFNETTLYYYLVGGKR